MRFKILHIVCGNQLLRLAVLCVFGVRLCVCLSVNLKFWYLVGVLVGKTCEDVM